jgi:capsular polysaccharide synthesis protein
MIAPDAVGRHRRAPLESARYALERVRTYIARERISRLIATNIGDIRRAAETTEAHVDGAVPTRVYVFWAQSIDKAPEVVQLCHEQLLRVQARGEVVALDLGSARALVEIPPYVLHKTADDLAMLSDVLRLELLARYGGVWADATCLALDDVIARTRDRMPAGFFAFARRDRPIASWFLASEPGGYVVSMWRAAMHVYWRRFDHKIHYFVVHHLFEALCRHDAEFRRQWRETPRVDADAAHAFQLAMREPYEEARYRDLLGQSFIHKLTYRFDAHDARAETMLGHLLRHGAGLP